SGWPTMPTRVMSPVPAGRGSRITPGGGPAMTAGPGSTAAGRAAGGGEGGPPRRGGGDGGGAGGGGRGAPPRRRGPLVSGVGRVGRRGRWLTSRPAGSAGVTTPRGAAGCADGIHTSGSNRPRLIASRGAGSASGLAVSQPQAGVGPALADRRELRIQGCLQPSD